ncbi:glycosyltransferase [Candidatus Woesearchaeota archaeon]|nr:glycosyltransferase [Candidatus Woesearchaeota archaeon]
MKPKISVAIPVYNDAKRLERTLKSLQEQTFKDFEMIVVDDCSPDNSFEVAKRYTSMALRQKKNGGPAKARNRAILKARGDIIAFTDSDVVVTKNWLKTIVETFGKNPKVGVLMGNTKIRPAGYIGDSISELGFPGGANAGFENLWRVDKNGFTDHITSCNFAARRSVFDKYGGFDESFPLAGGEDPELSLRLFKKGIKIKYCPDILVYHDARTSLCSFWKWGVYRGRSNYYFKQRVKDVGGFIKLRRGQRRSLTSVLQRNMM